jgi:hypothetical protein
MPSATAAKLLGLEVHPDHFSWFKNNEQTSKHKAARA